MSDSSESPVADGPLSVAAQIAEDAPPIPTSLEPVAFAVDAQLLRELGERLVGRPHIALAELIKNSYDADAAHVEISMRDGNIVVVDDGHGMTEAEFRDRWMRVGSPHKERERVSRSLQRPLTGSKGIGRLAVQFLGNELKMWTRSDRSNARKLYANVDWTTARGQDLLTKATAQLGRVPGKGRLPFPEGSAHGTVIELARLNQDWNAEELDNLGRQIWMLQAPFATDAPESAFRVSLDTEDPQAALRFRSQVLAYLDVAYATVKASLESAPKKGSATLRGLLRFDDGEEHRFEQRFDGLVSKADIEIRLYNIRGRQPRGLKVQDLRDYFNEWGGVHIYDAGFRLPYYGSVEQDWLGIERDHAHRLSVGRTLVPEAQQVENGLRFLPTTSRIFGQVRVSTHDEGRSRTHAQAQDVLQIQASRDRLVANRAFAVLTNAVRFTLDYYAFKEARRKASEQQLEHVPVSSALEELDATVEEVAERLDEGDAARLRGAVTSIHQAEEVSSQARDRRIRLLATLASAGASSLAYEHEVGKQLGTLDGIASRLRRHAKSDDVLRPLAEDLVQWVERTRRARSLFTPLLNEEQREAIRKLPARETVQGLVDDLGFILEGVPVEIDVPADMALPKARYAEWSAIFQNAFANAVAAMRGAPHPMLAVIGGRAGRGEYLRVLDKGTGIDLDRADDYFEPFERGNAKDVGPGSGLGLPIVRTLADAIGVNVRFVEPPEEWSTSLRLSWSRKSPR